MVCSLDCRVLGNTRNATALVLFRSRHTGTDMLHGAVGSFAVLQHSVAVLLLCLVAVRSWSVRSLLCFYRHMFVVCVASPPPPAFPVVFCLVFGFLFEAPERDNWSKAQ